MSETISCHIYKSLRRDLMYLYLPQKDAFDGLPEALMQQFGEPIYVMELELSPDRPLANADITKVIGALKEPGFYLQMPPKDPWAV